MTEPWKGANARPWRAEYLFHTGPRHPCRECKQPADQHVGGRCLFSAYPYEPMTLAEFTEYLYALNTLRVGTPVAFLWEDRGMTYRIIYTKGTAEYRWEVMSEQDTGYAEPGDGFCSDG